MDVVNKPTQSEKPESPLKSKARRAGKWLLIGITGFGVLGYFVAPPVLKSVLLKQLSQELHRNVTIDSIDINPYALSAKVSGVKVVDHSGKEVVGFDELFVNVSSASLYRRGIVVDEIRLQGPRVSVSRLADGKYDISDLLDEWMKPSEPSPTPRFSLNNIQVLDGKLSFDDQPVGKQHQIHDLNIKLPFISSLPYLADVIVQPHFSAVVNDSPLLLEGKSKPFSESRESELSLDLDRLDLAGLKSYLPATLPFSLESATVDTELKLVFKQLPNEVFSVVLEGAAHLKNLKLNEKTGTPLIAWHALDVALDKADLINKDFSVTKVTLDGLALNASVNKQGQLNWLALADKLSSGSQPTPAANASAPAKTPSAAEPKPAAPTPLHWQLGAFELKNASLNWLDESNTPPVKAAITQLAVQVGALNSQMDKPLNVEHVSWQLDAGQALKLSGVALNGLAIDLATHQLTVGEFQLNGGVLKAVRDKQGEIQWLQGPHLKMATKPAKQEKPGAPWVVNLDKFNLDKFSLTLDDQTTSKPSTQVIDNLKITAHGLSTGNGKKGQLTVDGRVNERGSIKVAGDLQLQPLKTALNVETQAIPILPFQPYFTDALNVALTRGLVSNKGKLALAMEPSGIKADYKGSVTLGDLLTVDKLNNADLLKWRSLYFGGIDFKLSPLAINVDEIALSDFYAKLIINPEGRLNLQDLVKRPAAEVAQGGEVAEKSADKTIEKSAAKPADKAGEKASDKAADAAAAPVPLKIGKVTLQGGQVSFSDFFVKPNYAVNLTKLGGRVTNLSSEADTVADLDVRGSYANSAPVVIVGKLNPLAAKSYLDVKVDIKGVDLVPFSPYSGKYAGYDIEKGKLSLDVAYKLENNKLNAENHLFIDQLTFGNKVDSPTATSLPVNLAIALLKNNRGEIDLNLPIAGSLDDPQFSIGGLVVKVIVNLFVKAVTSPFALLGSMFGGGEELSNLDFAPGRSSFDDPAMKKLESLAKALRDRDSLKLEITGRADPELDKEGLRRVAMERAMRVEKQKDLMRKSKDVGSADSLEISDAEYPVYLLKAYKEAKFPKPRNLVGMQKELPIDEMEKLMLTNLPATAEDVRALANSRAEQVQSWLVEQGKVPLARIFLLPPKLEVDGKGKSTRVDFSLR